MITRSMCNLASFFFSLFTNPKKHKNTNTENVIGDKSGEPYNVIKMSMSNKKEVLLNSPTRAPPNVKSALELRDYDTCLLASNWKTLYGITFQVQNFPVNLRPG